MEFLNSAFELEKLTMQRVHNEKVIPKRYRLTLGMSMLSSAKIIDNSVIYANSIFPSVNDEMDDLKAKISLRRSYQDKAIREIQIMLKDLRLAYEVLSINPNVFEEWTGLLITEENAIKGWRTSDKKRFEEIVAQKSELQ